MVITCAVCGAETTRQDNPHLPLSPEEIAQAAWEASQGGAAILHLHVRDEQGNPTQEPDVFQRTISLIRARCDMIIEVSTGGAVGMSFQERVAVLRLNPPMASLDCGTVNFAEEYILNPWPVMKRFAEEMQKRGIRPTLECFDLSHIDAACRLLDEGLIEPPLHFGFVMNAPGGVKYDLETLAFFTRRIPKDSYWTVMGIGGRTSLLSHYGAIALGGFIRVGLEDNVYYRKGVLAESNAQLVARAAKMAREAGCTIATPEEVRRMFGLRGE